MPGSQREDPTLNPNIANSYDQLLEQINNPYNLHNPSQPYLFMPNASPLWNSPLSPPQQDLLSLQRMPHTPTSNIPHNAMTCDNSVSMHSNSSYSVQNPYSDLENHGAPFMRSSSDLGLRLNHFASREDSQFSVENFASNMEAFNPMFLESSLNLIQSPSVMSMPTLSQEYQIGQYLPENDGQSINSNSSFSPCPPQSSTETQTTSINKFATKLSLGTWVSPLQHIGNNYPHQDSGENSCISLSHLSDYSVSSHCQGMAATEPNSSFPSSAGRAKKNIAVAKPSYSDVLSKKTSQEAKGGLNGFQPSYNKQNNLFSDSNSGHQKSRGDPSHKSTHSKKGKNAGMGARCNSPNTNVNYSNVNSFSKEGAYSKVGLDRFDVPENTQNSKSSLHYHAYKNNLNCPSKTCNLDLSDKSLKKSASSSHSSPVHSKRVSPPPKGEKKNTSKLDDSLSTSDSEKVTCDQLNNHVPFSQQKQTPKRTCFINNNLSPSATSTKTNNSASSDTSRVKSGVPLSKDDLKENENACCDSQSLKFASSDLQECPPSNSGSVLKEPSSRCPTAASRGARVSATNKERVKDTQGKRNNGKKKKESQYNHSELLMAGWTLLLVWIGVAAKAGLWLLFLILDVVRMSSRLFVHMCLQVLSSGKLQCLRFKAYGLHHCTNWMGYLFKQKKESKRSGRNERKSSSGLETNIPLPTTGEEAMKRLLACRGKDPYSILGVTKTCSDDDVKKYYKRQAFLVHPDKNKQPGAEEAFKILAHAFEIIGEPERRVQYDTKLAEEVQFEGAWGEMASLLSRLKEKLEEAANTIRCTNCNRRHRRVKLPRPIYAARHCADCQIKHGAREGDIWAESCFFGLRWRYFACMEGAIYDISEWAACQRENLKHLQANTHSVQYRIVSGRKNSSSKNNVPECPTDPELEEFFNNLCRERFRNDFVPGQSSNSDARKRKGKKKK